MKYSKESGEQWNQTIKDSYPGLIADAVAATNYEDYYNYDYYTYYDYYDHDQYDYYAYYLSYDYYVFL